MRIKTDASVRAAKPDPGRQVEYRVEGVRGLALRVTPNGKKTWTLRYRNSDGEQRRMSLGVFPEVGLARARRSAESVLGAVADGDDPARARRVSKAAARSRAVATVADLIEGYLRDAEKGRHRPHGRPKRAGTIELDRYYYKRLIKPRFGKRPIAELTRAEIQKFLDEVGETSYANARHCRNVIRQAYNYAIRREVAEKNPAQFADLPRPASRERVLSDDELRSIWAATAHEGGAGDVPLAPGTALAIRLAMLTLQRGGEVTGIHAREIDPEAKLWRIPGERTKNHRTHVVPLSDAALEVLDRAFDLHAQAGTDEWQGFAFPSPRSTDQPITRHALSRATKRLTTALGIHDATPHDFRRTGASNMTSERIGIRRFIVSRVLNQISDTGGAAAVTNVYDRNEYLPDKRHALDAWAALLGEIVT